MTEKAGRLLLALFFDILQLQADWHFRADYDYEIPSQPQGNRSQLFFMSMHCSQMLQDILMSCRCKSILQKQVTNSGKMNEFLKAQLGFCVVWVLLRKTKAKNNVIQELEHRPLILTSTWIANNRDSSLNSFFHWHPGPQRVIECSPRLPGHWVRTAGGFQPSRWECHMSHQA